MKKVRRSLPGLDREGSRSSRTSRSRRRHRRLGEECAKLDPEFEQALADEGLAAPARGGPTASGEVRERGGFPVFDVPEDAPPITPEMVREAEAGT